MKSRLCLIAVAGILIAAAIVAAIILKNQSDDANPAVYFLQAQGTIHCEAETDIPVNFFCFADAESPAFGEDFSGQTIETDNEALQITESHVEVGDRYHEMALYSFFMTFSCEKAGTQEFHELIITDQKGVERKYPVGEIQVIADTKNQEDILEIREHLGSGDLGGDYTFTVRNSGSKPKTIRSIDYGLAGRSLEDAKVFKNGKEIEIQTDETGMVRPEDNLVLETGDTLTGDATFQTGGIWEVYFVSPVINCSYENEEKIKSFGIPMGLLGIPVNGERVQSIYSEYFSTE